MHIRFIKTICLCFGLLSILVLSSCGGNTDAATSGTAGSTASITTSAAGTVATTDFWSTGVYIGDVVPDKRTAQKIADVLFAEIIEKAKSEYTYTNASYDEEQSAWVVVYTLDKNTVGGYGIVISKKTGEVLRIENGE